MSHKAKLGGRDLVFVGDAHIDRDDEHLDDFVTFLRRLAETTGRLVLIGDLFNLWIGRRELEQPHQQPVLEALEELRGRGVVVRYLEGNRDYRVGPAYSGTVLDDSGDEGIVERIGGHSVFAVHGDLANPDDRQYRAWRRVSRSAAIWNLFNLLPRTFRLRLAESVEARLRSSNLNFKRRFPEETVREYAAGFLSAGHDIVVLGHFHVERDLSAEGPGPDGRILVLPEWRSSRRHLRMSEDGRVEFVNSISSG